MDLSQLFSDPSAWYSAHQLLTGQVGINVLLALSVWITLYAGQLALASIGFMAIGAYTSVLMTSKLGTPYPLALAAGCGLAAAAAVAIGSPVLRLRGIFLAIATIGFAEVLQYGVILNLPVTGEGEGLTNPSADPTAILPIWLVVAVLLFGLTRLRRCKPMEAWAAMRQDELAAASAGIDVARYKLLAFGLGAVIAALAGGLDAHMSFIVEPASYGFSRQIEVLIMVVVGGTLLPAGPLVGAVLLTLLPEIFSFATAYSQIFYGVLFMAVVVFRPQGLVAPLGRWRRPRVMMARPAKAGAR
jgi:branched-chain amino acid transport system permease protein